MTQHFDFTFALHHNLAPAADRSFCWSPYSVASAVGMAAAATAGAAHDELVSALRCEPAAALRPLDAAAELAPAPSGEPPVLAVANTLWVHQDLSLNQQFLGELAAWPGSAVRTAPFRSEPEQARKLINSDVAETTRQLIPELLPPGTVDPDTVASLVNALYLKVAWKEPFDQHQTTQRVFHAPGGDREVPTMRTTRRLGYAAVDGWQLVGLPAAGGVEALVLLPDDLPTREQELTPTRLQQLLDAVEQQRVELLLPRFKVTGEPDLQGSMSALGVRTVFTPAADFTPLTSESLRISTLVHQSVLEVDESGLEGAAATAAMMRLTSAVREPDPITVEVDRPFLFLVRHQASGSLYFLARVTDPS